MKRSALFGLALLIATPALAEDELVPAPTPALAPALAPVVSSANVVPSSEIGRYQLFESQFAIGTVKGTEIAEKHLLKIDTATGEVWIGKQTQYMDKKSGKLIQQRYWEPFEHYLEAQPFSPPAR